MLAVEFIGIAAGTLSTAAFVPQAYAIFVSGESDQLSLKTHVTLLTALCLYVVYGFMLPDGYGMSLLVTNSIQTCIVFFIVVLIVQHKMQHQNHCAACNHHNNSFIEYKL